MGEDLPNFVTPIPMVGEKVEPLVMPPDIRKRLQEQLDEIDRSRAEAMRDAHRVWIR